MTLFVPGGATNRDKRGPFVRVGGSTRDKKPLSPTLARLAVGPGTKATFCPEPKGNRDKWPGRKAYFVVVGIFLMPACWVPIGLQKPSGGSHFLAVHTLPPPLATSHLKAFPLLPEGSPIPNSKFETLILNTARRAAAASSGGETDGPQWAARPKGMHDGWLFITRVMNRNE